jgi:Domain of unknown function (DUF4372)
MYIDNETIRKIAAKHQSDRYVKKFTAFNHLAVMRFIAFEGYQFIREAILGLLANAHKLPHLGMSYVVRRSTFSKANLLIKLVKSRVKRKWAFSNMVSIIRQQLMNYIDIYFFLANMEGAWLRIIKQHEKHYEMSLFPELRGAYI